MSRPLTRAATGHVAPPIAAVHLGLGAFFRAHQAVYTALAPDADAWGYAAFTGRSSGLAEQLQRQDGLYTLLQRAPGGDEATVVGSVARAYAGGDTDSWISTVADPGVRLMTLTVTESAYRRGPAGGLDLAAEDVKADLADLQRDPPRACRSVPGRLVAGLAARARAGGGALAIVPCDNLPDNGKVVRRVVLELAAEAAAGGDRDLPAWITAHVSFVSTEVDRITPRTTPADIEAVRRATGRDDACPVVTEPFTEWTLAGDFPGGRPAWEAAGARFVEDVTPYETRKLWLLNGAHSLLAYAGSALGHTTVAEAIADPRCRSWVEAWWDEAGDHLTLPAEALAGYRVALAERFANPAIRHLLSQIAMDGSQKLPVRIVPTLLAERLAGRTDTAGARVLGAWIAHLRGAGAPVSDPRADELVALSTGRTADAVPRVLAALDPRLADDQELVAAITAHTEELSR
ncbi:mannitol dehydrogenase family protein [Nocardioides nematodiphilus]|uniref:mannitol dehydrogenase family protein n=1 Tax=Nocardioides nematodiphilus TaxID=2849669 RepID=UPI001CD929E4|nr:mannitol dehydrogenase family protein [Nocardioides nematodiphilus]MCA1982161.1 mannitol dehydrogenase family protein [Nocardioides nematodiphilus]